MSFSKLAVTASILATLSRVSAHGTVSGIVVDGTYFQGYSPSFQFANPAPVVVGWSIPEDLDNGFVSSADYSDPDIICHKGATPGQASASAKAGSTIDLQWTTWPESHHGPVMDYLANCNGPCESVDKTKLEFFKIDQSGLIDGTSPPGKWASDDMIANNNTWTVKLPSDIAPGNYVLRHETIALHSAGDLNGAQNYPQCFNLVVESSGTAAPAGVLGTDLYKNTDAGIKINIYTPLSTYDIPGPALYTGGAAPAPTSAAAPVTTSTAAPVPTSSAASSSAAEATTSFTSASADPSTPTSVLVSSTARFCNSTIRTVTLSTTATTPAAIPAASTSAAEADAIVTSVVKVVPVETPATPADSPSPTNTPVGPTATRQSNPTTPTSTSTSTPDMPAGTTFKTLMAWMDSVVKDIAGGNKALLGRRHSRDLVA